MEQEWEGEREMMTMFRMIMMMSDESDGLKVGQRGGHSCLSSFHDKLNRESLFGALFTGKKCWWRLAETVSLLLILLLLIIQMQYPEAINGFV